eukprot:TRINITY_DN30260_c0_g1_i1.p1 TRINITY_DN30260_c0_g1~~TRINITY_DN30260_c0_g1_i1.p1  ORF type:complete len:323 (-),score=20.20 TRINITY_DN30260_c0_g1_i1:96-1064(-)
MLIILLCANPGFLGLRAQGVADFRTRNLQDYSENDQTQHRLPVEAFPDFYSSFDFFLVGYSRQFGGLVTSMILILFGAALAMVLLRCLIFDMCCKKMPVDESNVARDRTHRAGETVEVVDSTQEQTREQRYEPDEDAALRECDECSCNSDSFIDCIDDDRSHRAGAGEAVDSTHAQAREHNSEPDDDAGPREYDECSSDSDAFVDCIDDARSHRAGTSTTVDSIHVQAGEQNSERDHDAGFRECDECSSASDSSVGCTDDDRDSVATVGGHRRACGELMRGASAELRVNLFRRHASMDLVLQSSEDVRQLAVGDVRRKSSEL